MCFKTVEAEEECKSIGLLIAYEIRQFRGEVGYEVVISRTRYVPFQTKIPTRGVSLTNRRIWKSGLAPSHMLF